MEKEERKKGKETAEGLELCCETSRSPGDLDCINPCTLLPSPPRITIIGEANVLIFRLLHGDTGVFGGLHLLQQGSFDIFHCVSCIYNTGE